MNASSRTLPVSVYLDHAATTPMLAAAVDAMTAHLRDTGNPSSLHASGRRARRVVEESRETIAQALNCRPGEVVFTSGGTEADNLAVKGIFWSRHREDPRRVRIHATSVEHHAVLYPLHWLDDNEHAEVELLPVDRTGRLDLDALRAAVERDPGSVALISVMWANNEVGTLQPIPDVVALAAPHGIPVHTDAVQAIGAVPVDFAASGVDALTLTGHKVGGPYGVGALVVRRELDVTPLVHGGGQERDIRSGTIDTPAIAGLAAAVELSVKKQADHAAVHQRGDLELAAYDERADAVRTAHLVPGQREGVDAGGREVHWDRADRLHRVGVHRHAVLGGERHDLLDRLERPDLVVGPHHRDQRDRGRVAVDRLAERVEVEAPERVDRQQLDLGVLVVVEPVQRVQHGVVLDGGREDADPARVLAVP